MKKLRTMGIIFLVMGLSFLASDLYRSGSTESYGEGVSGFLPLQAHSWNIDPNTTMKTVYVWSPRSLRMDINTNGTIDLYIVNEAEMRQYNSTGTFKPLMEFREITKEIINTQIGMRDKYSLLIYNPTNASVDYEINATLYGLETDLFWASIAFMLAGTLIVVSSILLTHKGEALKTRNI